MRRALCPLTIQAGVAAVGIGKGLTTQILIDTLEVLPPELRKEKSHSTKFSILGKIITLDENNIYIQRARDELARILGV
jgi:hypothetical protein